MPRLIFCPYRNAKVSAFLGNPTWSPKMNRLLSGNVVSLRFFPPSSSTKIWRFCASAFTRASNPVLSVFMPGWVLPEMTFLSMTCQVAMSVRTSWRVSPSIFICRGGLGAPFRTAWKVTSRRSPCERNRLLTMHSCTTSSLPASWRLLKVGLV